jgi:cell division protein FtsX
MMMTYSMILMSLACIENSIKVDISARKIDVLLLHSRLYSKE